MAFKRKFCVHFVDLIRNYHFSEMKKYCVYCMGLSSKWLYSLSFFFFFFFFFFFIFSVNQDFFDGILTPLITDNCNAKIAKTRGTQPFQTLFSLVLRSVTNVVYTPWVRHGNTLYATHTSLVHSDYTLLRLTYKNEGLYEHIYARRYVTEK